MLATNEEADTDEMLIICIETIYNLSCSEERIVLERMGIHPGLLMALGCILRFRAPNRVKEVSAMIFLHRIAQIVVKEMSCQEVLFSALVQGSV